MIPLVAWRNIWRHKIRSLVVISAIAIGLWAGVFMMAFSWGMYKQYLTETVETNLSHIQIHNPGFNDDRETKYLLVQSTKIFEFINTLNEVKAVARRTISSGMVSSPTTASGVSINGIFPKEENEVTKLASKVVEGKYLDSIGRNPILIGSKLAKKLKVKLKNKIILTFQDTAGEIVAGAFRVAGIYKSKNTTLEEMNVYIRSNDLNRLLVTDNSIHEIAVLLNNDKNLDLVRDKLKSEFKGTDIKTWRELAPELDLIINSFNVYMYIFVGIILLALTFGIVNTMLMAVLERVRELGMLMAIGMSRVRIFLMIMLETIYLALVGGPFGLFIGYFTIKWTGNAGIDMSMFSEGLSSYGFSTMVYPELDSGYYLPITLMTIITAVLSAIYPALRALRLKPTEAIRKI